jgi:hypothetical protein
MQQMLLERSKQFVGLFLNVLQTNVIHNKTESNLVCLHLLKSMRDCIFFMEQ